MNTFLTVPQTAAYLQVHVKTLYTWINENKIPHYRIGGWGIRIKKVEIDEWIEKGSSPPPLAELLPRLEISLDGLKGFDKLLLIRRTEMNGTVRWTYPHGSVTRKETKRKKEVYSIDFQVDGLRVRKTLKGVRKRAEAVKVLNAEVVDAQRGKYYFTQKNLTFSEMADRYLEKYSKVNKKSWKTSDWVYLRRLKPYFGKLNLSKISPEMIEEYRSVRLSTGIQKCSVNREVSCLRKIFNVAIAWGYTSSNPVKKVKMYSEKENFRERFLTEDEEER